MRRDNNVSNLLTGVASVNLIFMVPLAFFSVGLVGCEDPVRSTVLDGLQSSAITLAETLITAFFLSFGDNSTTAG